MGQSTNGILVYGIAFEDEDELPESLSFLEEFDGDFDEYLESLAGLPKWGEPGHSFEAVRAHRETCPADLVMHCSGDFPMYILAVRGTEITAHRGHAVEITSLDVPVAKVAAFKQWCAERGIEGEPKWYLCSMWN